MGSRPSLPLLPAVASAVLLLLASVGSSAQARAGSKGAVHAPAAASQRPEDVPEQTLELDDLAPAAVTLDVSRSSPLIQVLYAATRETKEAPTLDRLREAKRLIESGADLHATDDHGRSALHWAIFGASYATKPSVLVSYEEIADALIRGGVDLNRQDAYNDTALDYMLYAPSFEIQTLLLEAGATSGFFGHAPSAAAVPATGKGGSSGKTTSDVTTRSVSTASTSSAAENKSPLPQLSAGKTLSVRLDTPVYSDRSRTGDPVTATVTYPLCRNGEDIACPPGELLVAPGTKVLGTVLFAQKAPDKYWRPRMVIDFATIVHADGSTSDLYSRVLNVDNARETVRNNEIFGIVQPHANGKASMAFSLVGAVNPIAGFAVRGVQTVYGLSIRREILFPAGTDLQLQVVRPSTLQQPASWAGWPLLSEDADLRKIINAAPGRVTTPAGAPSDLTNLLFIGSREEMIAAFREAGWYEADALSLKSGLNSVQATLRNTDYVSAPVSTLVIGGQAPDLVFQKSLDTFAQRHHVRIWKQTGLYKGREVWVGAATHDIAVSSSRAKTRWSHRVDPHIDRERDWIQSDLLYAGTARAYANLDRSNAPRKTSNATGDVLVTDGKIAVVDLGPVTRHLPTESPALRTRQSTR